ncbi:MAG: BrnT family toxin [Pusillimonas sp.]
MAREPVVIPLKRKPSGGIAVHCRLNCHVCWRLQEYAVSLARELDWPDVMAKPDTRRDYGELREIGYGVIENRLYCVVFTQRQDTMHVISLRKASSREVKNYVDT